MSSNQPKPEYLNRLNCVAKIKHTRKTATTAISASKSKGLSMYRCENCEFYHLTSKATEVGAKPTVEDLPPTDQYEVGAKWYAEKEAALARANQDNNFEQELTKILEHFRSDLRSDSLVESSVRMVEAKTALNKLYQSSQEEAYSQGYDDCLKEHGFTNIQSKSLTKDQEKQ